MQQIKNAVYMYLGGTRADRVQVDFNNLDEIILIDVYDNKFKVKKERYGKTIDKITTSIHKELLLDYMGKELPKDIPSERISTEEPDIKEAMEIVGRIIVENVKEQFNKSPINIWRKNNCLIDFENKIVANKDFYYNFKPRVIPKLQALVLSPSDNTDTLYELNRILISYDEFTIIPITEQIKVDELNSKYSERKLRYEKKSTSEEKEGKSSFSNIIKSLWK